MTRLNRLGLLIALMALVGGGALPFAVYRANRIVPGDGVAVYASLPLSPVVALLIVLFGAAFVGVLDRRSIDRLAAGLIALAALAVSIGMVPDFLGTGGGYERISPGSGFWVLSLAYALLVADALTRMSPPPALRIAILLILLGLLWLLLWSGRWDGLSVMQEYASRSASFWREVGRHLTLAFGSLAAAVVVGIPLGTVCHRIRSVRIPVLNILNAVQTIPSMALFGLMIAPLGWLAANWPLASALGIRGIGAAPALLALFLYSLLPVVANTVVGLASIPQDANDAARGVGMTDSQRLFKVEMPLAFPVILTAVRIVLVQNIGLVTIAALIGGGGLGVFVFQGIGQTAMDLVLLGALPTVLLAFSAAIVLDAAVEAVSYQKAVR